MSNTEVSKQAGGVVEWVAAQLAKLARDADALAGLCIANGLDENRSVGITAPTEADNRHVLHVAPEIGLDAIGPDRIVAVSNQPCSPQVERSCSDCSKRSADSRRYFAEFYAALIGGNNGLAFGAAERVGVCHHDTLASLARTTEEPST